MCLLEAPYMSIDYVCILIDSVILILTIVWLLRQFSDFVFLITLFIFSNRNQNIYDLIVEKLRLALRCLFVPFVAGCCWWWYCCCRHDISIFQIQFVGSFMCWQIAKLAFDYIRLTIGFVFNLNCSWTQ